MPHPRGGTALEHQIASLKDEGVDVVVSLLEEQEISWLELEKEKEICRKYHITYLNFPIVDRNTPDSFEDVYKFTRKLRSYYDVNKKIACHCYAGIGRSSLIAACLLILQGMPVKEIFAEISRARGFPVPDTPAQLEWAHEFAEKFGNGK